jgi:hypothetical protein
MVRCKERVAKYRNERNKRKRKRKRKTQTLIVSNELVSALFQRKRQHVNISTGEILSGVK